MKKNPHAALSDRRIVGWREWVSLPDLGITALRAKLDTGAKTSALHTWRRERFEMDGAAWVRFHTHVTENEGGGAVQCAAPLTDYRWIVNPGGTQERRFVITTTMGIGGESWPIELSLTERDDLKFRMLIGREAMRGRLIIDPGQSFRTGRRHSSAEVSNSNHGNRTISRSAQ